MIPRLRKEIIDEIVAAFGFAKSGPARRLLGPLFWLPANLFAHLMANVDHIAAQNGLANAAEKLLARFVDDVKIVGSEYLPKHGPLLIASNHPGAYDILVILSNLTRDDIKIVVSDVPLIQSLPALDRYMIYTPAGIGPRMSALRRIIRHLQNGGVLLIFPSGKVDPDPQISGDGEERLELWSSSLEIVLQKVPDTKLSVSIVSGVIAPRSLRNPLIKIIGEPWRQQKLAEILQVIQQLLFSRKFDLKTKITFGLPSTGKELQSRYSRLELQAAILDEARFIHRQHLLQANEQSSAADISGE